MGSNREKILPLTREQVEKELVFMRNMLEQARELERTGMIDGVRMSMRDFLGETESIEHIEDEISRAEEYLGELDE